VIAEVLLTILATTRHAEAMIGNLNERFTGECEEFGRDRSVRVYWARTPRSVGPLLWRTAVKAARWGVVLAALRRSDHNRERTGRFPRRAHRPQRVRPPPGLHELSTSRP
jgi:hypothetical protein